MQTLLNLVSQLEAKQREPLKKYFPEVYVHLLEIQYNITQKPEDHFGEKVFIFKKSIVDALSLHTLYGDWKSQGGYMIHGFNGYVYPLYTDIWERHIIFLNRAKIVCETAKSAKAYGLYDYLSYVIKFSGEFK